MPLISGSEDVYRRFVDEAEEDWLYGLVAFAVIEELRIEWMKHFAEHNGGGPSANDIKHWYEQQTESVLLNAKGTSENALQAYASEVLQEVIETERKELLEGAIVDEIRLARRFWPQFGVNVAAGFASALLFAAALTVVYFVAVAEVSPQKIGSDLNKHQTEEKGNGKKVGE